VTNTAWLQYITYGGLPYCALLPTAEEKADYLTRLFEEVYVRDIMERHHIQHPNQLEQLMNIISSGIGFHGSCSLEWLLTVGNAPK
jgi:predicted AAA+ superfamily ATPase